jgi:hypothetical protein
LLQASLGDHQRRELVGRGDDRRIQLDRHSRAGGPVLLPLGLEQEAFDNLEGRHRSIDQDRVEHEPLTDAGDAELALDPRVLALDLGDAIVQRGRHLLQSVARRSRC